MCRWNNQVSDLAFKCGWNLWCQLWKHQFRFAMVTWPSSDLSLDRLQTSQTVVLFFLDCCWVPSDKTPPLFKEATRGWWEKTSSHVQLLLSVFHRETVQQFLYDSFSPCIRTTVSEVSLTPWQKPLQILFRSKYSFWRIARSSFGALYLIGRDSKSWRVQKRNRRFTNLLSWKVWKTPPNPTKFFRGWIQQTFLRLQVAPDWLKIMFVSVLTLRLSSVCWGSRGLLSHWAAAGNSPHHAIGLEKKNINNFLKDILMAVS